VTDEVTRAIETVTKEFPFPGYIEAAPHSHRETALTVLSRVPRGGRILEFAAGPLDKTAILPPEAAEELRHIYSPFWEL
jgi:hypothetical protein